jgi:threonine/homoserine/homoserine lactone efflux protein
VTPKLSAIVHASIRFVITHFLAFLGVSAVVIVTPGQDTALTIRNTLLGGRRAGASTALGVSAGQAVWALATSAGVAALLRASEPAFLTIKLAGAAYLVWLGLRAIFGHHEPRSEWRGGGTAFRQGLVSNLGNPKMAIFFGSLLPQFASPSFASLLVLGLCFCSLTLAWLSAYALAVARAGDYLRRTRVRRALDRVTGAVLVGLGIRLAAEQR